ncbi:hypothetical protein [Endozoicomonas sp. 2B-B]
MARTAKIIVLAQDCFTPQDDPETINVRPAKNINDYHRHHYSIVYAAGRLQCLGVHRCSSRAGISGTETKNPDTFVIEALHTDRTT